MSRSSPALLPRLSRLLETVGGNLKLARLRRKFSAETVSKRAGISRKTLYRVEQGDPAVALGIFARVLQVLRLEQDMALLAADDVLGRKLLDSRLATRQRSPRRRAAAIQDGEIEPDGSLGPA